MEKQLLKLFTILLLFSCGQQNNSEKTDTIIKGNISTTLSADTAKLSRLINIKDYKPTSVKFKYVFIDNSGKNERSTIPGPSDSYLQAVIFFDSTTFQRLKSHYFSIDYSSPNYIWQEFNFDWLDINLKQELKRSDSSYHGHPDYLFGLEERGKLWFLENKILLVGNTH